MINLGIIRNITDKSIYVEPCSSEMQEEATSCGAGGCESCGHSAKKRLIQVLNPHDYSLEPGNRVEIEIPSSQVIAGVVRILLIPMIILVAIYLFTTLYLHLDEQVGILAGLAGFALTMLLNVVIRKKSDELEKPQIIKVL